ncbi:hypothetical protein [Rothia sp. L_38]|uniref:hypothetical protein n=1 Tax=Rothia sp. L_38 TaxID=3422315 RepID=UPI003D6B4080
MLKLIFWPVLVPSFLFAAGFGAVVPIQILAAIRLGASPELASLLVAASGVLALFCTVPVGATIDRVGDKRAMTLATLSAAGALTLSLQSPWLCPWLGHCGSTFSLIWPESLPL